MTQQLRCTGLAALRHVGSSRTRDQTHVLCLCWQADSYPLSHQLLLLLSRSVVPDSLGPHGLQPTRLLRPWDFPGKRTGVGCHRLLCTTREVLIFFFKKSFHFPISQTSCLVKSRAPVYLLNLVCKIAFMLGPNFFIVKRVDKISQ